MTLTLPWSHRLPDYARVFPSYGQNVVALARALPAPLQLVDVGANVGDTTLQVLAATDARSLCVEADPYWLDWLHRNVDGDPRVVVQAGLLVVGSEPDEMAPVRVGGTTRFVASATDASAGAITLDSLRASHPGFDSVGLVKSDTDGYDVTLVPALAAAYAASTPVLFFEYDHRLSRVAGNDPVLLWPALRDLGYARVAVWDHIGNPLGLGSLDELEARAGALDGSTPRWPYWDVAAAHVSDAAGVAALDSLMGAGWSF